MQNPNIHTIIANTHNDSPSIAFLRRREAAKGDFDFPEEHIAEHASAVMPQGYTHLLESCILIHQAVHVLAVLTPTSLATLLLWD